MSLSIAKAPRPAVLVWIGAAALIVAALAGFALWRAAPASAGLVGGPFALETAGGKVLTDVDLRGRPFLVYFGYTHCPDVCPTTLAEISEVLRRMPGKAVKALFITVDPERDTPAVMADYVSSFDSRIVGLSGSPQAIAAVEKEYRIYAHKGETKPDGDYLMDHVSVVYLMNSDGGFAEIFNLDRPPEEAAKELAAYL